MREVQLDEVEARGDRAPCRRGVLRRDRDEVLTACLGRNLVHWRPRDRRWRDERPVAAIGQRLGEAFPQRPGGTLAAGMADLHADAGRRVRMDRGDDPAPRLGLRVVPQSWAAGRDPGFRRDTGHLGDHQARTPERMHAQVHGVPVSRHTVRAHVLGHGRYDEAVHEGHAPQRAGCQAPWRPASWPGRRVHLAC
jgi:hypothetical protein